MWFLEEIRTRIIEGKDAPWCVIEDQTHRYSDLQNFVSTYQHALNHIDSPIGIVLRNDFETYASLIACWLSGRTYVPLNPNYPISRLEAIIEAANIQYFMDSLAEGLNTQQRLEPVSPDTHSEELIPLDPIKKVTVQDRDWAYILFTSGTTGKPKGVPISFGNLSAFFDGFLDLGYTLSAEDRFLNMFELTFDLSVMSYGVPTLLGASFYVPSQKLVKPLALYDTLESHQITFALMVPSAVDLLAPYADELELPHLKVTQFCGEALKLDHVRIWRKACGERQIDNVYGPTEATIYCSRYTVPLDDHAIKHHHGNLCIGTPMKHAELTLLDDGELALGGNQITPGYLNPNEDMLSKFMEISSRRFYRSGDLGSELDGQFFCHGRRDDQIKIQGYRVELAEIEWVASSIKPGIQNRCIPVLTLQGWVLNLVFDTDPFEIRLDEINSKLPDYMHIKGVHFMHPFPLNANGKIDKKQIAAHLGLLP